MERWSRIADLNAEDSDQVNQAAELLVEGFRDHHPLAWPTLESADQEVRASVEPGRISRVAVDSLGRVVGWIGVIPGYGGRVWEIHPLVVRPAEQGKGIGSALVRDVEGLAKQRRALTLLVGTDDEDGQTSLAGIDLYPNLADHLRDIRNLRHHPYEFYQKMGFTIVGVVPDANGAGKPDILMAKRVREIGPT